MSKYTFTYKVTLKFEAVDDDEARVAALDAMSEAELDNGDIVFDSFNDHNPKYEAIIKSKDRIVEW
jgi:hypothetical protein